MKIIKTKRQKTLVNSNVPLLDVPKAILEKYKNRQPNGKLLPVISNQKMNEYLDEIATLCNIDKHITFHAARHIELPLSLNLNRLQRFVS